MEPVILNDIALTIEIEPLAQRLHIDPDSGSGRELAGLVREAERIARPKAMYGPAYLTERSDDGVVIDGVAMSSRVLRVNLDSVYRVFPYAATCGTEVDEWSKATDDVLHQYWTEAIKLSALGAATKAMNVHLEENYRPGKTSRMNPGSLLDWPLTQQRPLFALLGDPEEAIGIHLTKSCLMEPNKSVSGIAFAAEHDFQSCQLCPRDDCPGRRAPYDERNWDQYRAS